MNSPHLNPNGSNARYRFVWLVSNLRTGYECHPPPQSQTGGLRYGDKPTSLQPSDCDSPAICGCSSSSPLRSGWKNDVACELNPIGSRNRSARYSAGRGLRDRLAPGPRPPDPSPCRPLGKEGGSRGAYAIRGTPVTKRCPHPLDPITIRCREGAIRWTHAADSRAEKSPSNPGLVPSFARFQKEAFSIKRSEFTS